MLLFLRIWLTLYQVTKFILFSLENDHMESSKRCVKLVSLIFIVSIFKIRDQKLHLSIKLYIAYRCDQQQPPNHKRQTEKIETVIDILTCSSS